MAASGQGQYRYWRSPWALIVFLIAYAVLLAIVSHYYLLPALDVFRTATPRERRLLSASSALLLAVILFIVGVGILLTFRVSRFFFPAPPRQRTQTQYVDAWAESANRVQVQTSDSDADDANEENAT